MLLSTFYFGHVTNKRYQTREALITFTCKLARLRINTVYLFLVLLRLNLFIYCEEIEVMGGGNCAFFGCPTSGKHKLSLFRIPRVSVHDGEHTKQLKQKAREEWVRLILRTRETTEDLKKRIEANNIFVCELHFKPECIVAGILWSIACLCSVKF